MTMRKMTMHRLLSRGALGVAAAATFTLAACSGATQTATSAASSAVTTAASSAAPSTSADPSVSSSMQMSMTGGTSSAAPSSGAASSGASADAATHNEADVTFLQMMLPHHRGAVEMAQLAPTRAANAQVKELAAQIEAAQAPEIEQMTSWLQAWGVPVDTTAAMTAMSTAPSSDDSMGGMDHGGMTMGTEGGMGSSTETAMAMPGEMTAEQMTALEAASGTEFDRMFLEMMIEHHTGAVEMAQTELDAGVNTDALELAESIKASQTEEIATMQQLLQTL